MKKIFTSIAIALIPAIFIVGGLYVAAELKMNKMINDAVNDLDDSYYKGIASTCFKKDRSEYECCIASVYAMSEVDGIMMLDDADCIGVTDQLRCAGSFTWCTPQGKDTVHELSEQYEDLRKRCQGKEENMQKDCLKSLNIMVQNGYSPAPCDAGFLENGLDCIGCEDMSWCEPSEKINEGNDLMEQNVCTVDGDCVADKCCHATGVVNKEFAPDCSDAMCTMSCETVLDCGRGKPVCDGGVCGIEVIEK